MRLLLPLILVLIFSTLSFIHIYWAFGGKCGTKAVLPKHPDASEPKMPGFCLTLAVAIGLFAFGFSIILHTFPIELEAVPYSGFIYNYGLWFIIGIFIVRAVGEFRYIGLFKTYKNTPFGKNDTQYYTPLCLVIVFLTLILEIYY